MKWKRILKWSALAILRIFVAWFEFAYWTSTNDCGRSISAEAEHVKAIRYCEYGSPDVLKVEEIAKPMPNYYVGLPFFGLAATVCAWLWLKSKYIPRGLATFGVIASAWCVFCAFVYLIFPNFNKIVNDYIFDSPMALFELVVSFWLLFKGLRPAAPIQPQAGTA